MEMNEKVTRHWPREETEKMNKKTKIPVAKPTIKLNDY